MKKLGVGIILAIMAIGLTGCKDEDSGLKVVDSYKTLELTEIARHRERGNIRVTEADSPNNTVGENDKSDNVGSNFNPNQVVEQLGNESYVTKFGYSQLLLENADTTEYFQVSGDDIVYGGVTYMGLNKALDSFEYPYDKTTLINFIVKTYDPMDVNVEVTYTIADDSGNVEGWSVSLDESLEEAWSGYANLREEYGKPVKWTMTIADYETFDRQSYLYGCSDYMIYLSYTSGETIDMSNFEEIKP